MPRPKSTIKNIQITKAGASHNCKNNNTHRIQKGEDRLTIKEGRSSKNYCTECAKDFLKKDIEKLNSLVEKLNTSSDQSKKLQINK